MRNNRLLFFVIGIIALNAVVAVIALNEIGIFNKPKYSKCPPCKMVTRACNTFVKNKKTGLVCVFDSAGIAATFYDTSNSIGNK